MTTPNNMYTNTLMMLEVYTLLNNDDDPYAFAGYSEIDESETLMQQYADNWQQQAQISRENYIRAHDGVIFRTAIRVHVYDIISKNLIDTIRKTEYMNMDQLIDLLDEIPEDMEQLRIGSQNKFKKKHKGPDNPPSDWWDANIQFNNYDDEKFIFDMRIVATQSN